MQAGGMHTCDKEHVRRSTSRRVGVGAGGCYTSQQRSDLLYMGNAQTHVYITSGQVDIDKFNTASRVTLIVASTLAGLLADTQCKLGGCIHAKRAWGTHPPGTCVL
eukprot:5970085-Amphidinium_carterae.1